jgi:hypothetical protein
LDALTEGESGFEEALLEAIAHDDELLNPAELFKADHAAGEVDTEDAAYWNVEAVADAIADETTHAEPEPLLETVSPLSATSIDQPHVPLLLPKPAANGIKSSGVGDRLLDGVSAYLETVHIIADPARFARLQAQLLQVLEHGVKNDDGTRQVMGLHDPGWLPDHETWLANWVRSWLRQERVVFAGCEDEVAGEIIRRAKTALNVIPLTLVKRETRRPAKVDLLAVPDDEPLAVAVSASFRTSRPSPENHPVQLALF